MVNLKIMYSIDELICVCISRQIEDGELVAQGMATPLVAAGYLLAKRTHAPNLTFISAIGQAFCQEWAPLGLATVEDLWIKQGIYTIDFISGACDFLPRYQPKEFFRPGQVDMFGNFNNVFMGGSYEKPRLRLPGAAGIPDVTAYEENVCLYVPRHGRYIFVPQLDFRSGLGHDPTRRRGSGPRYLVTNLGQFDFGGENGRLRLTSLHPGIPRKRVQLKTGFPLEIIPNLPETPPPQAEELRLLREEIDPLGIRTLETLPGAKRKAKLRQILAEEKAEA
jgi:acyl CoA:acetate/3-ketoacid CoA transferase beta subunit